MSAARRLRQIYSAVPDAGCRGLCAESCAAVPLLAAEQALLSAATGRELPPILAAEDLSCPLLRDGRCSVYADRPLVCRLFGAAEGIECPFGCRPARLLTDAEARALIRSADSL